MGNSSPGKQLIEDLSLLFRVIMVDPYFISSDDIVGVFGSHPLNFSSIK